MPEFPEVCTVKKELRKKVLNKEISTVQIYFSKILKDINDEEFKNKLIGQKILDINNFGKYLIINFEKFDLLIHLRMEGKLFYFNTIKPVTKHDHIVFSFTDGSVLIYNDVRKFGTFNLFEKNEYKNYKGVLKLGKEPLDESINLEYLKSKLNNNRKIKQNLLEQTIINGLGNIYVDEILFAAKIHPESISKNLSDSNINDIIYNMRIIIKQAIENNGTTIKSFSASDQVKGNYQQFLKVYKRYNQQCFICNSKIKKIKVGGRGTHYCPKCQKLI